jgi:hypothetical protein
VDSPACRQTPGSAPQPPLFIVDDHAGASEASFRIGTLGGSSDLAARVLRVTLIPATGPATVIDGRFGASVNELYDGRPITALTIPLKRVSPGHYRVLVEDRDLSAPPGCAMTFRVVIGSLDVK